MVCNIMLHWEGINLELHMSMWYLVVPHKIFMVSKPGKSNRAEREGSRIFFPSLSKLKNQNNNDLVDCSV